MMGFNKAKAEKERREQLLQYQPEEVLQIVRERIRFEESI